MSWLGRLFGTEKATEKAVNGLVDGLDKLFYTDEEKAQDGAKDRSEARRMLIEWQKNTQGQNLSRRLIALFIMFTWILQYIASCALNVAAVWVDESEKLNESARLIAENNQSMTGAVMLLLSFYFAAPHMGELAKAAIVKFGVDNTKARSNEKPS